MEQPSMMQTIVGIVSQVVLQECVVQAPSQVLTTIPQVIAGLGIVVEQMAEVMLPVVQMKHDVAMDSLPMVNNVMTVIPPLVMAVAVYVCLKHQVVVSPLRQALSTVVEMVSILYLYLEQIPDG